jgi:hypothetical protein
MIASGTNALASSIVLVCRKRAADAPTVSRREFLRELNAALPEALLDMTRGGVNSARGTGGFVASHHRPRHGDLQPVRRRAGSRRQADERAHCAATDQPLSGRRRFRPRHAILPALVRAAGLGHRQIRRCRRAGPRQGHQRRRPGSRAWWSPARVSCACCAGPRCRATGRRKPTPAAGVGGAAPADPRLNQDGESAAGACWRACPPAPNPFAPWPTASIPCANAKAGRRSPRLQRTGDSPGAASNRAR